MNTTKPHSHHLLTFVCLSGSGGALLLCFKFGGWIAFSVLALAGLAGAAAGALYARSTPNDHDEQQRRRRQRDFMQRAIDAMPEPVFVKNLMGQLVMVNKAYCRQRQLSAAEILGRSASSLARNPELARLIDSEDDAVLTGREIYKEESIEHPVTGAPLHQIVTKTRSFDEEGYPVIIGSYFDITPLREAEREATEALAAQTRLRQFQQFILNANPNPLYVKDAALRYLLVNTAYARTLGLNAQDLPGRSASEVFGLQLGAQHDREDRQLLDRPAGELFESELQFDLDGTPHSAILRKLVGTDPDGQAVIVGALSDVTELKQAQDRLAASGLLTERQRDFLQTIFDAVPIPLFVKDSQQRYILSNLAHARYEGVARQHIIGRIASSATQDESIEFEQEEKRLLASPPGTVFETECESLSPGGTQRFAILRDTVCTDPEGQHVIVGALTELTAQRHAEARWKFALEGAGDGIWDWDLTTGKTFYSPRWKAMQGFGEEEIGDSDDERTRRIHPDDQEAAHAALMAHLEGIAPLYICELRQLGRHGQYLWMLDRGQVVEHDAQGRPTRMIGTYTDITSRKQIEAELRRHRNELRDMVAEQTHDLILARDAAEQANEAKNQFLANMSHELRTPMHAVLSFARMGSERVAKASPEKLGTYFQRIHESGERLHQLLSNLLDLSHLDAGRMVLRLHPVDLSEVIVEALRELAPRLDAQKLTTRFEKQVNNTHLTGDGLRLGQVVRNLLGNAIQYSPAGSQILLSLRHLNFEDRHEAGLELSIADEGIGIPANELEHIFDKFEQSSKTRNNAGGTGLGLPICREIILRHQGLIFARQRPGGGSEFIVQIPLSPSTAPTQTA